MVLISEAWIDDSKLRTPLTSIGVFASPVLKTAASHALIHNISAHNRGPEGFLCCKRSKQLVSQEQERGPQDELQRSIGKKSAHLSAHPDSGNGA